MQVQITANQSSCHQNKCQIIAMLTILLYCLPVPTPKLIIKRKVHAGNKHKDNSNNFYEVVNYHYNYEIPVARLITKEEIVKKFDLQL